MKVHAHKNKHSPKLHMADQFVPIAPNQQRTAVRQSLRHQTLQTKLKISEPEDEYEQEADRIADQVMRMADHEVFVGNTGAPEIQRQCSECEEELHRQVEEDEEEELIQPKHETLQRQVEDEEEEMIQAKHESSQTVSNLSSLEAGLNSIDGAGQSLPEASRAFFEPRFERDFSEVRIHQGTRAAQLARSARARAFTRGRDVVFAPGEYAPHTQTGKHLLAHELTHVIQQTGRASSNTADVSNVQRRNALRSMKHLNGPLIQREALKLYAQRPGPSTSTGHAFVGLEDDAGREEKWGFYPACTNCVGTGQCSDGELASMLAGLVGIGVGGVVCDDRGHPASAQISYRISNNQYRAAQQDVAEKRRDTPSYNLFMYNCVHFVSDVAEVAGHSVPNFGGIDEPEELTRHINTEHDRRVVRSGRLSIERIRGSGDVDISAQSTPHFRVANVPNRHRLGFRWIISDDRNRSYQMWSGEGRVFQYRNISRVYIPSRTRALLRQRNIRNAEIRCRVIAARGTSDAVERLLRLPVVFRW